MKARLLAGIYIALVAYCVLSATLGAAGIGAERQSLARIEAMRENRAQLEAARAALETRLEALSNDPEMLLLEARELGYLDTNEGVVRGIKAASTPLDPSAQGTLLAFEQAQASSDRDLKIAAALIGLAGFALSLLLPGGARRDQALRRGAGAGTLPLGRKTA